MIKRNCYLSQLIQLRDQDLIKVRWTMTLPILTVSNG